ncbi:MAG: transglutaminase-like cysteine peptidase [Pseudomonadota bacterium]
MRNKSRVILGVGAIAIGMALTTIFDSRSELSQSTVSLLRGSQSVDFGRSFDQQFAASGDVDRLVTGSVNSGFFRTSAISFANLTAQSDWNRVRSADFDLEKGGCNTQLCDERLSVFSDTVSELENASFFEKLQTVNSVANNAIKFAPDSNVYKKKDHWASANQTISVGYGDCEDYAILKYAMLLEAGVPASSMSLIVLKDTDRNLYHAVLAVSTNKGHLILDNVAKDVYRDTSISHYQPLFSFSDDRSWIHGVAEQSTEKLLAQGEVPFDAVAPGESTFDVASLGDIDPSWFEELRPAQPEDRLDQPNFLY